MSDLIQHVGESIRRRRLLRDGSRVLVAVSGGVDSMALLHALHSLAVKHRWRLAVAHFNHQLRGAASEADERLVEREAKRLELKFVTARWPREQHRAAKEHGLEMAARLARHEFLARAARRFKAAAIALAHHADDQAELFFLRLLRGSGGEGLAGMKWAGPSPADGRVKLIRPLLDLRKDELEDFARQNQIAFREDASNRDTRHERNWLRQTLLPALTRRFGASSIAGILRVMELTGSDADFVQRTAAAWLAARPKPPFDELHSAVQRQCLKLQLKSLGLAAGFDLVEHLRLIPSQPVAVNPRTAVLRDDNGKVGRVETSAPAFSTGERDLSLSETGRHSFAGVTFLWNRGRMPRPFRRPPPRAGGELFDAAKVGACIRLRHWRPGDRFQPIGMKQPVKLQDLFTNAKIPAARRRQLIVAETERGQIFWVEGLRIGEQFKLDPASRERLRWHWQRR